MKKLFTLLSMLSVMPMLAQWTAQTPIPVPRAQHGIVSHPNGNIYLFNGWSSVSPESNAMYIYNVAANTWTTGPNVPITARGVAYCLGDDNNIYSLAGYPVTNTLAQYNPVSNTWSVMAACPSGAWEGAMTSYNNRLYFAGGKA